MPLAVEERRADRHRSSVPGGGGGGDGGDEPSGGDSHLARRRPLSKSDFDLSYPEDLDRLCKRFAAAERRHVTVDSFASTPSSLSSSPPSTPAAGRGCCPTAINSSSCAAAAAAAAAATAAATGQSAVHGINVVQKTHSFFSSLKVIGRVDSGKCIFVFRGIFLGPVVNDVHRIFL